MFSHGLNEKHTKLSTCLNEERLRLAITIFCVISGSLLTETALLILLKFSTSGAEDGQDSPKKCCSVRTNEHVEKLSKWKKCFLQYIIKMKISLIKICLISFQTYMQ